MTPRALPPMRRIVTGISSAGRSCVIEDSVLEHRGVLPPRYGTVLRVIDIPPEDADPAAAKRHTEAMFAAMFPDAHHDASHARHPGMHTTDTIDYAILLQGELIAILEEGETLRRAGDILIQRRTHHAWANRSQSIARIAFILIDGERVPPVLAQHA